MGSLFSLLILLTLALISMGLIFCIARFFVTSFHALSVAIFSTVGAGAGVLIYALLVRLTFGNGALHSRWQVIGFLSGLAVSGIAGAATVARLVIHRLRRSYQSLNATGRKTGPSVS